MRPGESKKGSCQKICLVHPNRWQLSGSAAFPAALADAWPEEIIPCRNLLFGEQDKRLAKDWGLSTEMENCL
jgi:hypothetical protein